MGQSNFQRLQYFGWAAQKRLFEKTDFSCPACGHSETLPVGRKYVVTTLRECQSCSLRFRFPKENEASNREYYQKEYSEGFTTTCPSDKQLGDLVASAFRGSECDYTRYIDVMHAIGLHEQQSVLDFGSSWGYGSWQLRDVGFDVWSYEISMERARYAGEKLGCKMVDSLDRLDGRVDCLFTAHVIEHLPNPTLIWSVANRVLKRDGVIVCFCPNGNPALESSRGRRYYGHLWGKHHPMVIAPRFMLHTSARFGFESRVLSTPYASPYSLSSEIPNECGSGPEDEELCMIACRSLVGVRTAKADERLG